MKVLRKRLRERWELVEIENGLEALQAEVNGYIETITLFKGACFIVNEEGRLLNLELNTIICGIPLFGTILMVGISGDEFCDCPNAVEILDLMNQMVK